MNFEFSLPLAALASLATAASLDSNAGDRLPSPINTLYYGDDTIKNETDMTVTITDLAVTTIDGKEKPLADYTGKVLLIVNVASRCGYTPQYTGLEQLYRNYQAQGLEVLAFPCNDYGGQEPGTNEEIVQFCSTKYDTTFPLFDKVHAKGAQQHPLYARLTAADATGDVSWNFEKFLVNKQGEVVARFKSAVKPDAPELIGAIEQALAK